METESSTQSPFQKLNLGNSSQKTHKIRYQNFLVLFTFTGFFYVVPNVLTRFGDTLNSWFHQRFIYLILQFDILSFIFSFLDAVVKNRHIGLFCHFWNLQFIVHFRCEVYCCFCSVKNLHMGSSFHINFFPKA